MNSDTTTMSFLLKYHSKYATTYLDFFLIRHILKSKTKELRILASISL